MSENTKRTHEVASWISGETGQRHVVAFTDDASAMIVTIAGESETYALSRCPEWDGGQHDAPGRFTVGTYVEADDVLPFVLVVWVGGKCFIASGEHGPAPEDALDLRLESDATVDVDALVAAVRKLHAGRNLLPFKMDARIGGMCELIGELTGLTAREVHAKLEADA